MRMGQLGAVGVLSLTLACVGCGEDGDTGTDGSGGVSGNSGDAATTGGQTSASGGGTGTTPNVICLESDSGCSCLAASEGEDTSDPSVCTAATTQHQVCCANPVYPETGMCFCDDWGCSEASAMCTCGFGLGGSDPAASCSPTFTRCCASVVNGKQMSCVCHNESECFGSSDVAVPSCDLASVTCNSSDVRLDGCR